MLTANTHNEIRHTGKVLASVPVFKNLPATERAKLAGAMEKRSPTEALGLSLENQLNQLNIFSLHYHQELLALATGDHQTGLRG